MHNVNINNIKYKNIGFIFAYLTIDIIDNIIGWCNKYIEKLYFFILKYILLLINLIILLLLDKHNNIPNIPLIAKIDVIWFNINFKTLI